MCGRYILDTPTTIINERFNSKSSVQLEWKTQPKLDDIAPGRDIPIIKASKFGNQLDFVLWGWWFFKKGPKGNRVKQLIINSRDDTILKELENPAKIYQKSLSESRVLIPAQGFYEWPTIDGKKTKKLFKVKGQDIFSFAGFDVICKTDTGSYVVTTVIVTIPASEQMSPYHDRQPLIIPPDREQEWIDCSKAKTDQSFLESFFQYTPQILIG